MHTGCNCVSFGIIPGSVQEISSAVFQYASASLRNQIKNLLYVLLGKKVVTLHCENFRFFRIFVLHYLQIL